jgi:transposase
MTTMPEDDKFEIDVSTDARSLRNTELGSPLNSDNNVPPLQEEGRMLRKEDGIVIQALIRQGMYLCAIARQLGVHPKTVRRALARGRAPEGRRGRRRSQLDPYRADIDRLLTAGVSTAAMLSPELRRRAMAIWDLTRISSSAWQGHESPPDP